MQNVSCLCPLGDSSHRRAQRPVRTGLTFPEVVFMASVGTVGSGQEVFSGRSVAAWVSETSFDIIRSHLRHSARNDRKSVVRGQVKSIHFGFRGHKASSAEYSRADWDLHANHPARLRVLASSSLASLFQGKQVRWRSIASQQHNHQQKCKRQSTSNLRFRRESGDSKAALLAVD